MSCQDVLSLLLLYLDYMYSTFLIYRLTAHDPSEGSSERLLLVAKNIISTLLKLNDERERVKEVRSDFFTFVGIERSTFSSPLTPLIARLTQFLPYGLPSAEVLTKELLRRPSLGTDPAETRLPRAEIIRELTVYTSCLSWAARPGSWNAEFCKEVKAKLIRILDQIINSSNKSFHLEEDSVSKVSQNNVSQEFGDMMNGWDHLFDWDRGGHWDSGLDFFCEPVF